jgi:hypothetical protein
LQGADVDVKTGTGSLAALRQVMRSHKLPLWTQKRGMGVSKDMRPGCRDRMSRVAVHRQEPQVVEDPSAVYVFNTDGTVDDLSR